MVTSPHTSRMLSSPTHCTDWSPHHSTGHHWRRTPHSSGTQCCWSLILLVWGRAGTELVLLSQSLAMSMWPRYLQQKASLSSVVVEFVLGSHLCEWGGKELRQWTRTGYVGISYWHNTDAPYLTISKGSTVALEATLENHVERALAMFSELASVCTVTRRDTLLLGCDVDINIHTAVHGAIGRLTSTCCSVFSWSTLWQLL